MKKIVLIVLIITLLYFLNMDEYNITEDSIRFRVIANSNSIKDIEMKEKVVKELSNIIFIDSNSKEEIKDNIYNNLNNIENKINDLFKKNKYNKSFNISYGLNEFPKKKYKGKIYKEGLYESLVIEIGKGKGKNYFCILYPSLCIKDYENNYEEKEYKFKITEIIKRVLNVKD